jgi:hypothetical protein
MTTPDPFACGCDRDAPICACLPLWVTETLCPTCHGMGRNGYCAPRKCHCNHPECPAFPYDPIARNAHREATHADQG